MNEEKRQMNIFLTRKLGYTNIILSFNSWESFGILWNWSNEQDWYEDFLYERIKVSKNYVNDILKYQISRITGMIDPEHYAIAIYEYLKDKK